MTRPEILTCYDLVVPDPGIADLLQSVRVSSFLKWSNLLEEHKLNKDGVPIITFVTGNAKLEVKRILGTDAKIRNTVPSDQHKVDLPNCKAIQSQ
jgi:hypothetical protein